MDDELHVLHRESARAVDLEVAILQNWIAAAAHARMTPRLSWLLLLLLLLRRPPAPPLPPFQPLTPEQLAWQEGEVTTLIHFNMATFDT